MLPVLLTVFALLVASSDARRSFSAAQIGKSCPHLKPKSDTLTPAAATLLLRYRGGRLIRGWSSESDSDEEDEDEDAPQEPAAESQGASKDDENDGDAEDEKKSAKIVKKRKSDLYGRQLRRSAIYARAVVLLHFIIVRVVAAALVYALVKAVGFEFAVRCLIALAPFGLGHAILSAINSADTTDAERCPCPPRNASSLPRPPKLSPPASFDFLRLDHRFARDHHALRQYMRGKAPPVGDPSEALSVDRLQNFMRWLLRPPGAAPSPLKRSPTAANVTGIDGNATASDSGSSGKALNETVVSGNSTAAVAVGTTTQLRQQQQQQRPRVYMISFTGDVMASDLPHLTDCVSFLIEAATPNSQDEVVLKLESPGGAVAQYGLAAAQLERLKKAGIRLVVCVDEVAASGGYMMAVEADELVVAPFAVVGSIGVIGSVVNFNRALRRFGGEQYKLTAGEHKGSLDMLGEVSPQILESTQQTIEDVQRAFKAHVKRCRPLVDVDVVATGKVWLGRQAQDYGLVDTISTSDEYLNHKRETHDVLILKKHVPKHHVLFGIRTRLGHSIVPTSVSRALTAVQKAATKADRLLDALLPGYSGAGSGLGSGGSSVADLDASTAEIPVLLAEDAAAKNFVF